MERYKTLLIALILPLCMHAAGEATLRINQPNLMHETRSTPSPLPNATVSDKNVSFMWPLENYMLYYTEGKTRLSKPKEDEVNYRIRFSKNPALKGKVFKAETCWPFYNPEQVLSPGVWYWQYGYVNGSETKWSDLLRFEVKKNPDKFTPPPLKTVLRKLPMQHPRVLLFKREWNHFIEKSKDKKERAWFLESAAKIVKEELVNFDEAVNTSYMEGLTNQVQRTAMITRESRRIVDKEERYIDVLIRSYLLTKEKAYFENAMARIEEMVSWKKSPHLVGDFNEATILSVASLAYDSFYHLLTENQKEMLKSEIKETGGNIFRNLANRLENHIADNHIWQMNLRIFTLAAFAMYGDLPEAKLWVDYAYNLWLARFPGLNADGAWHNGDSYFHTNLRTLVEVPYFYSKVTGYNFFADPWYNGSAMYVITQQPPFSKSGGNGSQHQSVVKPRGTRVGYADAIARLTGNAYLTDYVNVISEAEPDILYDAFGSKPGDLSWFRLHCDIPLPTGASLSELPLSYVFPQTGLASFMSDWQNLEQNAMCTFRSSPYGSTSHALANQNAFNTFYGGKPLFYSSGHHSSFVDAHSLYCHRASRAHNTILVNSMGQKIGTEGYGWIPRHYTGEKISYLLGDASNAYGKVVSPIWLERARNSELSFDPTTGWDENHVNLFRRHVVMLGGADLLFIYDELEADTEVDWNYLLHTVENPMIIQQNGNELTIRATNEKGVSDAYLFSDNELEVEMTNQFFVPAVNWLRADDKGYFQPYRNHWHLTATAPGKTVYRFATVINTRGHQETEVIPKRASDTQIEIGEWIITLNLSTNGQAGFTIKNDKKKITLTYDDSTVIQEGDNSVTLVDQLPELEI